MEVISVGDGSDFMVADVVGLIVEVLIGMLEVDNENEFLCIVVEVVFGIVVGVAVGATVNVEIDCVVDNTVVVRVEFGIKVVDHKIVFVFDFCVLLDRDVEVSVLVLKVVVDAVVDAVVDVSVLIGREVEIVGVVSISKDIVVDAIDVVDVVVVKSFGDGAFIADADTHGSIVSNEVLLAVVENDPVEMSIIGIVEIGSGSVTNVVDAVEIYDLVGDDVVVVECGMVDWVGVVSNLEEVETVISLVVSSKIDFIYIVVFWIIPVCSNSFDSV